MEYKLVVVTRSDLRLSPGKSAAQVAHASVTCALDAKKRSPQWFKAWFKEGQRKVVLKTKSLESLYEIREAAMVEGLTTALITDAGLTEVPPGTVTCVGIGPGPDNIVDRITGSLSLL